MKIKYRQPKIEHVDGKLKHAGFSDWIEFDSRTELVCPCCLHIGKRAPDHVGMKTVNICNQPNDSESGKCTTAMYDVELFHDMVCSDSRSDQVYVASHLDYENMNEYHKRYVTCEMINVIEHQPVGTLKP